MAFYIKCVTNGMVLDVKGNSKKEGTEVILFNYKGGKNQLWEYKNNMIYSCLNNRLVLDIAGGGKTGGALKMWPAHGSSNQLWFFDDDFTIRSGTGLVMDVEGGSCHSGAKLIGYNKHGGHNQKFRVEPHNNRSLFG